MKYVRPRSVKAQVEDLRNSGCSEASVKTFLDLSVRLGKISESDAKALMIA
jgi:hypothetical protein